MNWKKLFAVHILERGYNYYCENAVENMYVSSDIIRADVMGTEDYEVEISLSNGKITDMYCSCPYAADGKKCKHMAAVLYQWSENKYEENTETEDMVNTDLFGSAHTKDAYRKKSDAVNALIADAEIETVRSFLADILVKDEKLLLRFHGIVNKQVTEEDMKRYIRQIDTISKRYLGRNYFIGYYEADGFLSELEDIIDEDVRRMVDNENYISAFEVINYIFTLLGNVDMDDSDGGTGVLADKIYQLWQELLVKVNLQDKQKMFNWFTAHLDGSIIDYLEEYIEQIVMEEFEEKEYKQQKLLFVEGMIEKSQEKDYGWSTDYNVGKWALRYLEMLKEQKAPMQQKTL